MLRIKPELSGSANSNAARRLQQWARTLEFSHVAAGVCPASLRRRPSSPPHRLAPPPPPPSRPRSNCALCVENAGGDHISHDSLPTAGSPSELDDLIAGGSEVAELLLTAGADTAARDRCHCTPLHTAAWFGREETLEVLVGAAAPCIDARSNPLSWTPLHCAAWRGHGRCVMMLLAAGADAEARDSGGNTAVHMAAASPSARRSVYALQALLLDWDAQVDVDARNKRGCTPLHEAAANARGAPAVLLLLSVGADASVLDPDGRTPLEIALVQGNSAAARELAKERRPRATPPPTPKARPPTPITPL